MRGHKASKEKCCAHMRRKKNRKLHFQGPGIRCPGRPGPVSVSCKVRSQWQGFGAPGVQAQVGPCPSGVGRLQTSPDRWGGPILPTLGVEPTQIDQSIHRETQMQMHQWGMANSLKHRGTCDVTHPRCKAHSLKHSAAKVT